MVALLVSAAPTIAGTAARPRTPERSVHRVAWTNPGTQGFRITSARPDGSDRKVVFRRTRFLLCLDLTMSHSGREIAFAPYLIHRRTTPLWVTSSLHGGHWNALAGHPRIVGVGGIAWSPNDRRLAFEGTLLRPDGTHRAYLWTVGVHGAGLTRVTRVRLGHFYSSSLAWTGYGIFYAPRAGRLAVWRDGSKHAFLTRASDPRVIGDGRRLTLQHSPKGGFSGTWAGRANGSHLRPLLPDGGPDESSYGEPVLSHDGIRMVVFQERLHRRPYSRTLVFDTATPPTRLRVLHFTGGSDSVVWN
jgi:hypothetical protein